MLVEDNNLKNKELTFTLRKFTRNDIDDFVNNINTESIEKNTTIKLPFTKEQASWWIDFINNVDQKTPKLEEHFVIEVNSEFAGSIAIINIVEHRAELGYWLVEKFMNNNIMTNVVAKICNYAFEELNLVRLFAPVLTHNIASYKMLEKNNFVKEGILKKYDYKNGQYLDVYSYAKVK